MDSIITPRPTTLSNRAKRLFTTFTTKDVLVGDYDYAYLFTPHIPFTKKSQQSAPFFGVDDQIPVLLALLLGLQHSLAMLAGVISPPILLGGSSGANFEAETYEYLVSTSLIVSGLLSFMQMIRFHVYKTKYFVGTGLISVVGCSFATITVATGTFSQMYSSGYCPVDAQGNRLSCPRGYGALLGTSCLCSLLEIGLSFLSSKILKRIFPPLVTGPTVLLIGAHLVETGMKDWAGGSGSCGNDPASRALCPSADAPHALPWGSAEFIGLGFLVFLTIILCERFGSPIMKSCAVVVEGPAFDSRIQGGVLGNGFTCLLAGLCTITPMSVFAQNNGVIALTKCANRKAGYCCCLFLIIMGIFAKFAAALVAIPSSVFGGMTTFLFSSVAVSGIRIITSVPFTRRNRFILTASFAIGMAATLVPDWFSYVFTYSGDNRGLTGLLNAIELVMTNGFAVTALIGLILNLLLPEDPDEETALVEARPDGPGNQKSKNVSELHKKKGPSGAEIV